MNESTRSVALMYARGFGDEECGASGILITDDWVVSHGSLLSARVASNRTLGEFFAKLETGKLTSMPDDAEDDLELRVYWQESRCRNPSKEERFNDAPKEFRSAKIEEIEGCVAVAWRCPLLEKTFRELPLSWSFDKTRNIDSSLLSIFLMVRLKKKSPERSFTNDAVIRRACEALTQFANKSGPSLQTPPRSTLVEVSSTPFGNPVFIDSVSRGVVSNVFGEAGCIILTDANSVPGSEGAPVYVTGQDGTRRSICGMVIAPLSWCRGEWVDYTFAASILPCLRRSLFGNEEHSSSTNVSRKIFSTPDTRIADLLDKSLVLVRCGDGWGTGIILDVRTGTIITCSHVVHKAPESRIKVVLRRGDDPQSSGSSSTWAKLVYRTAKGKPYDVAVLRVDPLEIEPTLRSITIADVGPVIRGEAVGSAGFPFFSSRFPTITRGNVSGVTECMLQTTCCIQSGSSGGPIVRWSTGEMLGMVVCNAKSTTKSKIYPRLNMAVPASVLERPLREYLKTGEATVLEILNTDDPKVRHTWNFHHLPSSKI